MNCISRFHKIKQKKKTISLINKTKSIIKKYNLNKMNQFKINFKVKTKLNLKKYHKIKIYYCDNKYLKFN